MLINKDKEGEKPRYAGWLDLALQMALTLAISVLAGFFGGRWLDNLLGFFPWLTIIFTLWSTAGGMVWVIIKIKQYGEAQEKNEQ